MNTTKRIKSPLNDYIFTKRMLVTKEFHKGHVKSKEGTLLQLRQ